MEEGSLRCEPNLSLRLAGSNELGTKVELKNINSFKFAKAAMEYEIKRQTKVLDEGGKVVQETRLWDTEKGETAVMRTKEEAHDYRYFPEPDLVPLRITPEMVEEVRKTLPELPEAMRKRFMEEYGLPEYDADVLTSAKELAKFFEDTVKAQSEATALSGKELGKETSNWVMVELLGLLHKGKPRADGGTEPWTIEQDPYEQSPVKPEMLADLLVMKRRGEISGPIAKTVLEEMFTTGKSAAEIVKAKGLTQVSDEGALEKVIDEMMAKNPQQLAQYRSGKEQVFGFFVGQVMKASGGKANPAKVNELLKRKLAQ
jgi:aspartyl-tRNA(Asn)/glutamyl-tRNA(Gln) amidotransferase subunit B